jgi:hypothetical protein
LQVVFFGEAGIFSGGVDVEPRVDFVFLEK